MLCLSVITQSGDSALTMAARDGRTEVVSLLLEAEANTDLQNKVVCSVMYEGVQWFYCVRRTSSSCVLVCNGPFCEVMHCVCLSSPGWILGTYDSCQQLQ